MRVRLLSVGLIFAVCGSFGMEQEGARQIVPAQVLVANGHTQELSQIEKPSRLLDPTVDYMFKQIFGQNEDNSKKALIGLLNAILGKDPEIKQVQLGNTEISKILENDKTSRLDIRASCNNNTELNIEMQCKNTGEIPERAFHYLANMVPASLKEGETYRKVKYISIWILKENVTSRGGVINEARMCFLPNLWNEGKYTELTDKARIFFIELERYDAKNATNLTTEMQDWLSFLRDPQSVANSTQSGVPEAVERLRSLSADKKVREEYATRVKTMNDHQSEIITAEEKGKAEGEKNAKIETAKNALSLGLPAEQISKITGLSIAEIENLR